MTGRSNIGGVMAGLVVVILLALLVAASATAPPKPVVESTLIDDPLPVVEDVTSDPEFIPETTPDILGKMDSSDNIVSVDEKPYSHLAITVDSPDATYVLKSAGKNYSAASVSGDVRIFHLPADEIGDWELVTR